MEVQAPQLVDLPGEGRREIKSVYSKVGELQRFLRDRVTVMSVAVTDYFRMPVGVRTPIPIILLLDQI